MLIYTEARFISGRARDGFDYYSRDALCNSCGKTIGSQTKYHIDDKKFYFNERDKATYKFCPYCGRLLKK